MQFLIILFQIPGLLKALSTPNGNVCSNYSPMYVERTYEALKRFQEGVALFTFPESPIKCPGAPQKILYIAEHYLRKVNHRKKRDYILIIDRLLMFVI